VRKGGLNSSTCSIVRNQQSEVVGSSYNTLADVNANNKITNTSVGPRVIQLGLKLLF
jgi:hypothetical protein